MNVTTVGIDLAKNVFSLHGVDRHGKMLFRKSLSRAKLLPFLGTLPPCLIGMEACSGAHYWGRELVKLGHQIGIMAPRFVVHTLGVRSCAIILWSEFIRMLSCKT